MAPTGSVAKVAFAQVEGCDCEDCRADRHVYSLYERTEDGWQWAAISLLSYATAKECKQKHWWGIDFGPAAVWEDGAPVVEPEPVNQGHGDGAPSGTGRMVALGTQALKKSVEALEKHWLAG